MRLVAILALVLGLSLAGTAVYFASEEFRSMEARLADQRTSPGIELIEVAVAVKDLRFGQPLTKDAVSMAKWPAAARPPNAFVTVEELFGPEGTEERRSVLRKMEPGEPILASKVTEIGQPAGIAQRLSPGMRAFTIRVDVATGVSGFLSVGDTVDVYWTGNVAGTQVTQLISERLELIAIDQRAEEQRGRAVVARTVTVQGNPRQVAVMTQASSTGRLTLSLRGFGDETLTDVDISVNTRDVLGLVEQEPEAVEERNTVRIRRGINQVPQDLPTE
ncbi:MAG: Flp pilus assembly protein CpaB [Pseudomonadota bacterium]